MFMWPFLFCIFFAIFLVLLMSVSCTELSLSSLIMSIYAPCCWLATTVFWCSA